MKYLYTTINIINKNKKNPYKMQFVWKKHYFSNSLSFHHALMHLSLMA